MTGKIMGRIAAISISIALLLGAFWIAGPVHVWQQIALFPLWSIASVVMILGLNLVVVTFRLSRVLHHFGTSLPFRVVAKATVSGHLAGLIIISIFGQVVGRFMVLRRFGVSSVLLAMLTAYERIVLLLISGLLCFIGAVWLVEEVNSFSFLTHLPLLELGLVATAGFAFSLILGATRYEKSLFKRIRSLANLGRFLEIVLVSLVGQALVMLSFTVAALSLNPELDLISALAASAIISFAASMPISVNGWGVRELTAIYIFGHLGVSSPSALGVSILIGLISTAVILAATPIALRKSRADVSTEQYSLALSSQTLGLFSHGELEKAVAWGFALAASVLIFFQAHVSLPTGVINVNLADPVAILALAAVLTQALTSKSLPTWRSTAFNGALLTISILIAIAFYRGVQDIGMTQWAFAGRVLGWLVILGYLSIGYLLITYSGFHALRRFAETMVATAVVIIVVQSVLRWLQGMGVHTGVDIPIVFEGYSANRNAFVLQLVLCSMLLLAFSSVYAKWDGLKSHQAWWLSKSTIFALCNGVILAGIFFTGSLTGLITSGLLLVVAWTRKMASRKFIGLSLVFGVIYWALPYVTWALLLFSDQVTRTVAPAMGTGFSEKSSNILRWETISRGFELWSEAPFFGKGLGVFFFKSSNWFPEPMVIHSTAVWLLAEFGIVGLAIFTFLFAMILRQILNTSMTMPGQRIVALLLFIFAVFSIPHEIFYQRVLWLVLGAGMAASVYQGYVHSGWPKKVCHLITGLGTGGAERMLTRLVTAPNQDGMKHTVISLMDAGVFGPRIQSKGVSLYTLGMRRGVPSPIALWRLLQILRSHKPDVLMTWLYHADFLGFIAGWFGGVRRIYWNLRCSDMTSANKSWSMRLMMWVLVRLSPLTTEVLANSEAGRVHHLSLGYKPKAWRVIPNGVNLDLFSVTPDGAAYVRNALNLPSDALVVGHIARYHPMKDHRTLMSALEEVARNVPKAHFVLVGNQITQETKLFAEQLEKPLFGGRLHLLGGRSDIPQILGGLDVLVLSSAYGEGSPNVLTEAMACGVPCVTTDVGDAGLIVGDTGRVVCAHDPAAMARAIEDVLRLSKADHQVLSNKARKRVEEHYAIEICLQKYRDLILNEA